MGRYFSFVCLIVVLPLTVLAAFAQDDRHEDRYDGSEYGVSSFADSEFKKTDYKELQSTNAAGRDLGRSDKELSFSEGARPSRKRREDKGVSVAGEGGGKGPIKKAEEHVIGAELRGPVTDLPGDWVPDKIDLTNNGGFGTIPDNGSPLPYRLNGHVEIERGRSWAD